MECPWWYLPIVLSVHVVQGDVHQLITSKERNVAYHFLECMDRPAEIKCPNGLKRNTIR